MRTRGPWFRWLVAGVLLALGVTGCVPVPGLGTATSPPSGVSGLAPCVLADLPPEVTDAVAAVRDDGPYLRPRNDGGVFGNRERLLPRRPSSYYREYTVAAPGERFPGPRRLVTGGQRRTGDEPEIWFYTADHYESFCELLDP